MRAGLVFTSSLLALAFAGCAGGTPAASVPSASNVAEPSNGASQSLADVGSIRGLVVNEELSPLAGVEVAIVKPIQLSATTDSNGAFTFQKLEPGAYTLIAGALGYAQFSKRVDVAAGDATKTTFTLRALVIENEPWHVAIQKTAFFGVDSDFLAYLQYGYGINHSAINSLRCDPCMFVLHIEPNPFLVLTQVVWAPQATPTVNNEMCGQYQKNWSDEMGGAQGNMIGFCLNNRQSLTWGTAKPSLMKTTTKVRLLVDGGLLAVQWRMDVWTTFAYVADLPDDYTALPPP